MYFVDGLKSFFIKEKIKEKVKKKMKTQFDAEDQLGVWLAIDNQKIR